MIDIFSPEYLSEFRFRQTLPIKAVPTFLPTLNGICGDDGGRVGLAKGWFVVVAGNPGFGKSLLALLLARDSLRAGHKTAFVSLEMAHGQLAARFFSIASGIPVHALEKGGFNESAYERFKERIAELFPDGGLLTNRHLLFSLDDIMAEMAFMADKGVTVFFVDYLQLIAVGDEDQLSKQVTAAVTTLRRFAAERGVLVVALSQFNRSTSANYEQTPHIQGTHGGMIIEACADVGLLLDHSRYRKDEDAPHLARTFLVVDKNRHGARAVVPIEWDYKHLSCREGMPDEEREWPSR
jgi:replicative DNA helicase